MRSPLCGRMDIQRLNPKLQVMLQQIRELELIEYLFLKKADRLKALLKSSHGTHEDDLVYIPGGIDSPEDPTGIGADWKNSQKKTERTWERVKEMGASLPSGARLAILKRMVQLGLYRRAEVEAHLHRIMIRVNALTQACDLLIANIETLARKVDPIPLCVESEPSQIAS